MAAKDIENEVEYQIPPSTLETVDAAVLNHIDSYLNLFSTTNKGWKKTPVLWVAPERSYQRKKNKDLRDDDGTLILPLITIERTSVKKEPTKKGVMGVNIPSVRDAMGNAFTIGRIVNQAATARQANATAARKGGTPDSPVGDGQKNKKNPRPSKSIYDMITIPLPIYLDIGYTISLRTGFQQQMNELLTPFITRSGQKAGFNIHGEEHRYQAHFEADYAKTNNISSMEEEERVYQTEVKMVVNGYLIGDGANQDQPMIVRRQTPCKATFGRERSVLGDVNEWMQTDAFRGNFREDTTSPIRYRKPDGTIRTPKEKVEEPDC